MCVNRRRAERQQWHLLAGVAWRNGLVCCCAVQHSKLDEPSTASAERCLDAVEIELSVFVRRAASHYLTGRQTEGHLDGWRYPLLVRLAESGPLRSVDLARVFGLNRSTVGRHLARMETAGLVGHARNEAHAASSRFVVTAAGHAVLGAARRERMEPLRALLSAWPELERGELARLLTKLNHDLDARGRDARPH